MQDSPPSPAHAPRNPASWMAALRTPDFDFDQWEANLLKYSNGIRFPDDLAILRIHRAD